MYIYVYDLRFFGPSCLDKKASLCTLDYRKIADLMRPKKISFSRALTSWGRMDSSEQKNFAI